MLPSVSGRCDGLDRPGQLGELPPERTAQPPHPSILVERPLDEAGELELQPSANKGAHLLWRSGPDPWPSAPPAQGVAACPGRLRRPPWPSHAMSPAVGPAAASARRTPPLPPDPAIVRPPRPARSRDG